MDFLRRGATQPAYPPVRTSAMIDNDLGRTSRRQPIVLVVDLAPLRGVSTGTNEAEKRERTYTDNISIRGARVLSARSWQPGEQVKVIPVKEETAVRGEVVYCQKHGQDEFFVGIRLRKCPWWSVIQMFGVRP